MTKPKKLKVGDRAIEKHISAHGVLTVIELADKYHRVRVECEHCGKWLMRFRKSLRKLPDRRNPPKRSSEAPAKPEGSQDSKKGVIS